MRWRRQNETIFLALLWAGLLAFGLSRVLAHQFTPGSPADYTGDWPNTLPLRREPTRPTLVMLAHPKCPCTRASLSELNRILAQCDRKLTAYVVFLKPKESGSDWNYAPEVPGAQVIADENGSIARMLRASTSGQTFLFDRNGHLAFSGGITLSRGHEGDGPGSEAIMSLILTGRARTSHAPVFGCSLVDSRGGS